MRPKGIRSYAKIWVIKDAIWNLRFLQRMKDSADGWCIYEKNELQIDKKLDNEGKFVAFWHEIIHALDHEYDIGLTHQQVHKLEQAIARFKLDNAYQITKILF